MKKIVFITAKDAEHGFSLTGISQLSVFERDAEDALKKVAADPNNGLVIIDERLMKHLTDERMREIERGWRGILLVLPSPERLPAEAEDYAARLIRRAIGYHVRLRV